MTKVNSNLIRNSSLIAHVIAIFFITLVYLEYPFPNVEHSGIYNEVRPMGCNKGLALERNLSGVDDFENDVLRFVENTDYLYHLKSFTFSGSPEQTQAIKCEIWSEYQDIAIFSSNTIKNKLMFSIAIFLDPFVLISFFFLWFLLFSSKSISMKYSFFWMIIIGCIVGLISNEALSKSHFYRPSEFVVLRYLLVVVLALLLSLSLQLRGKRR
ncbi:hypothetical protein [Cycloclasticus pugetii]|uniref:hypothetical protein n=1 Tax=Cycloclasticus pugetii TaxID=34068 RepID=UPI003A8DACEE